MIVKDKRRFKWVRNYNHYSKVWHCYYLAYGVTSYLIKRVGDHNE